MLKVRIFQHKGKNYGVYESDCNFLVSLQAHLGVKYNGKDLNLADRKCAFEEYEKSAENVSCTEQYNPNRYY